MTDENRFFRYLWRFNAVAIALGVVLLLVTVASNVGSYWLRGSVAEAPPPEGGFRPVPKSAEREFTYRLEASAVSVLGDEQIFTLKRWKGEPTVYGLEDIQRSYVAAPYASSVIDDGTRDVNLLAVDAHNASSHWLFHGYQRALLSQGSVHGPKSVGTNAEAPAIAMTIIVASGDTNRDGMLDQKDRQSLYVYRAAEAGAVKLLDADFFLATGQLDETRYLVVYERGTTATAAIYSIPDFKLMSQGVLPSVPQ